MRQVVLAVVLVGAAVTASTLAIRGGAEEPKEKPKNRMDLLVTLKPGESKEVLLCTRTTRGPGVGIREWEAAEISEKKWSKHGISASVKHLEKNPEGLKDVETYAVTVTAAKDAKPGPVDLRIENQTTLGNCETSLKVLVTVP